MPPKTFYVVDVGAPATNQPWAITATALRLEEDCVVFYNGDVIVAAVRLAFGQAVYEQDSLVRTLAA